MIVLYPPEALLDRPMTDLDAQVRDADIDRWLASRFVADEATAAEHNAPWDGTPSGDGRVATEGPANPSAAHARAAGSSGATAADAAAVTGRADEVADASVLLALALQSGRGLVQSLDEVAGVLADLSIGEIERDEHTRTLTLPVATGPHAIVEAVGRLTERQVTVQDIGIRRPTLDDAFLTLTGHRTSGDAATDTEQSA